MHLRWVLGSITALLIAGWLGIVILAENFRRSFGASGVGTLKAALPSSVAFLLLCSLINPASRTLLHLTAVVAGGLVLGCLWLMRQAPVVASSGLVYLALWFLFYREAIRG